MFLKITSLVFLFIIRLRFPASKSIIQTLRSRYDNLVVKLVCDLEKLDYKTRKCNLDLEFLNLCVENNVIPKFMQFGVANKELRNCVAYRKCLNKKQRYRFLEKSIKSVKDELLLSINLFDYIRVCNLFLVKNDKSLRSHQKIHIKKLLALTKGINNVGHDPKTVIFNCSKYKPNKQEESLLSEGLQYSIPFTETEYEDFMPPFERLYRDIKSEEVSGENLKNLIK